jgi:putative glycosyltransferase (TIGR04348 family)
MKVAIVTPASSGSRAGNRVTALRWARLLRELGHRVAIREELSASGPPLARYDVLVALHARRSAAAIEGWWRTQPERPVIVALTGTDVYEDIHTDASAQRSLELASRLVVLQPRAIDELPDSVRAKARVIFQSSESPRIQVRPRTDVFEVCVLGHLRPVKDPFRTALAARLLPASSRAHVVHLGAALSPDMAELARCEMESNPRYQWAGDVKRAKALRVLARSRLLVQSSLLEGGANAISEAIATGVPVLTSEIPGSTGILGMDYPGYFPVRDTDALAALLHRSERDNRFYRSLKTWCRRLRPLVAPARERAHWRRLLQEVAGGSA